jgi:hypothetical protein
MMKAAGESVEGDSDIRAVGIEPFRSLLEGGPGRYVLSG